MTSQLFKPNLGMESVRTEGSVTEVPDGDDSPAGQVDTLSPETTNVPLFDIREFVAVASLRSLICYRDYRSGRYAFPRDSQTRRPLYRC